MVVDYTYQIQYEICALVFLCSISFQFFSSRKFSTRASDLFSAILICCMADLALDILGCLTVTNIVIVPIGLNYLINGLFYCLQVVIPGLTVIYVLSAIGLSAKKTLWPYLLIIPAGVFLLLQLTNPITGLFFSIEGEMGNVRFITGPLAVFYYLCGGFYVLCILMLVIVYRTRLSHKQIFTVILFSVLVMGGMIIQYYHPDLVLTGTAMTVSIMLWHLTLQNPESMMDSETGAYDSAALKLFLNGRVRSGKIDAVVVDISGLDATERDIGNLSATVMKKIGAFLSKLTTSGSWFFRDSKTRFWIVLKHGDDVDEIADKVVSRFNGTWDVGDLSIDLMANVLSVRTRTSINISTTEMTAMINGILDKADPFTGQKTSVEIDAAFLARHRRRQLLEESMRRSIKTGEGLYLCFQPIVNVKDASRSSAEALLRFNDPNLGAVSPGELVPIIEECGMAMFIDTIVVENACSFLSRHPDVNELHVNLSATEFFHNPQKRILEIVKKHNVDPSRICFEITESAAARSPELLNSFMTQMMKEGFTFSLDDYGTGYSNILQVVRMPFSTVKIDKVLLEDTEKGRKALESTVKLFLDLGIEPIVEGVESTEELQRVTQLGASYIQGYLFSPPLPEDGYLRFVKNGNKSL